MRDLLAFADRGDVREIVARLVTDPTVHGVVLDYDPLWLTLWRLRNQIGDHALQYRIELGMGRWGPGWALGNMAATGLFADPGTSEWDPPDPTWQPPYWDELRRISSQSKSKEGTPPYVLKACVLPADDERVKRQDLFSDYGETGIDVIRERRVHAEFMMPLRTHRPVLGGISIGSGATESATLGGIVRDQFGVHRGVTCAHVAAELPTVDQPAQSDNSAASKIGRPSHVAVLRHVRPGHICNPYQAGAVLNTVDAALVEFDPAIASSLQVLHAGRVTGIASKASVSSGSLVEIVGKRSGTRTLEVGGLALTYQLRDRVTGLLYCFNHLFELRWPSFWKLIAGRPVQAGDSGAWVLEARATGQQWTGMAIAGDRLVGYACFASDIQDWAQQQHGLTLGVA